MQDTFLVQSDTFAQWFGSLKTTLNPKVRLADLRDINSGRGIGRLSAISLNTRSCTDIRVVASQDLAEDEELFSVSRNDILSVENSTLAQSDEGRRILDGLDDLWLSLILVMMYEYLRGHASRWQPYFAILPHHFDTLMFWTDDQLAELQASAVVQKIGKDSANALFKDNVLPAVRAHASLFAGSQGMSTDDLMALAHRMGSTIMAYAFDLEKQPSTQKEDEEGYVSDEENDFLPKGMVPMADMLNANADHNNARLFYEEDKVVMRTIKPVKAGQELFNDYGLLPRTDLLRRYGYITDQYAKYDIVEISSDFVISTVRGLKSSTDQQGMTEQYIESLIETLDSKGCYEDAYDISLHLDADEDSTLR